MITAFDHINDPAVTEKGQVLNRLLKLEEDTRDTKQPPAKKAGGLWVVIGGEKSGGVVVRGGRDLKSPELERLATGATFKELERDGERIHFRKKSGAGPEYGWISAKLKGSDTVRPLEP